LLNDVRAGVEVWREPYTAAAKGANNLLRLETIEQRLVFQAADPEGYDSGSPKRVGGA
jgi:hypothetical protein